MSKPTTITLVAIAAVALFAFIGSAYWLEARGPKELNADAKPSPAFTPAKDPAPTAGEIAQPARDHIAQLGLEIERALAARDPQQRETAFNFLLPELLQAESQRVVEMVARQEPGEARDALRTEVARQWITLDRDAAVGWMKSLENEGERQQSAQTAVASLAAIAPEQAIDVADQFGVGRDDGYLEHMVQMWAEGDINGAERWLASQPDDARTAPLRARIERVREQKQAAGRETS